jgi:hypothetical protein
MVTPKDGGGASRVDLGGTAQDPWITMHVDATWHRSEVGRPFTPYLLSRNRRWENDGEHDVPALASRFRRIVPDPLLGVRSSEHARAL